MIPLAGVSLEAFRACPGGFPRYKGKAGLSATLNKFLRENGLMGNNRHTLYALRHSFEDRLLDRDVDECALVGVYDLKKGASQATLLALGRGLMVTYAERKYQAVGLKRWLCVNPISWDRTTTSAIGQNPGSLPFNGLGEAIPALRSGVTGARCSRGRLVISIPRDKSSGFTDAMTKFGSYHNLDYGLFYNSVRQNAVERVKAFASK